MSAPTTIAPLVPSPVHPVRSAMFASLGALNFRTFVASQVVSNTGSWTQKIAQDWLVLTLSGSAAALGITTALQFLPTILFGLAGGLIADRFAKRRVLQITQASMAVCSATLAVLCLTGTVQLWHIYLLSLLVGLATAVDNPARQAFVHEMVGPRQLRNAIGLNAAVYQLGALVGPATSAVLLAVAGVGWAFAVNAVTYLIVVGALALIRNDRLFHSPRLARAGGQLRSALRTTVRRPELLWPILLAGVCGFFTANFAVTMASFASTTFRHGAGGYAFLSCMLAVGSLTGSLLAARRQHARLRALVELAIGIGVVQLLAALATDIITLGLLLACVGVICGPFGILTNAAIQLAAGDEMRGRVMGVYLLVVVGGAALGGPVIGLVDQAWGPQFGLVLGGVVVVGAAIAIGLRLARATNVAVQPVLLSGVTRMRGWIPVGGR